MSWRTVFATSADGVSTRAFTPAVALMAEMARAEHTAFTTGLRQLRKYASASGVEVLGGTNQAVGGVAKE